MTTPSVDGGLTIRRSLRDGERMYFATCCRDGTPIEDGIEIDKTELKLAHNEIRSWLV